MGAVKGDVGQVKFDDGGSSVNPVIAGKMDLPVVDDSIEHDIKLSIQYNRKIKDVM